MDSTARLLLANALSILSSELCSLRDEESAEDILCRIECLYSHAIDLDLHGMRIPTVFFDKVRQCMSILDERDERPITYSGPGRPFFEISSQQLETLLELGFTTIAMANILGVSRSTVARRMRGFGLSASMKYCCISDDVLDDVVCCISKQYPGCGHKMMQGHLRAQGIVVQQVRMREALCRTDPEGVEMRKCMRIQRRKYNISFPLELWHIDGNHKLIRYFAIFMYAKLYTNKLLISYFSLSGGGL